MASGPITSQQTDGEKVETVTNFIFLGFKITTDSDWSHEIKKKESYDQPRQHIKKQRQQLSTMVRLVKAMVFPVVRSGCESWTMKKDEC